MQETRQRTGEWVNATVQENLWAGMGAGVLTWVVGYAVQGYSPALNIVTMLMGAGFFGLLCVIRFTSDERALMWDMHMQRTAENTIIELEETVKDLRSELKRVGIESRTNEFKAASADAKTVAPVDDNAQLKADVQNILTRWGAGAKFGRDHCEIGRARWEKASSFLIHCGVMVVSEDGKRQRRFLDGMTTIKAEAHVRDAWKKIEAHKNTNFTPALS